MAKDGRKRLRDMSIDDLFPGRLRAKELPDERAFYDDLAVRCESSVQSLGKGGHGFRDRKAELLRAAPNIRKMIALMENPAFIRPLLDLWTEEQDSAVPCTAGLLQHVDTLARMSRRGRLGRLALRELCLLFFSRYDMLPCLNALCKLLRSQFSLYKPEELLFGLDKFRMQTQDFLQLDGHIHLARLAVERGTALVDEARACGIPVLDSRFFEASQRAYYLARLRALRANEENDLLDEIQERRVYDTYLSEDRRLGHEVLTILIDTLRAAQCPPSERWRTILLTIAGDPRVPITTDSYMTWWARLDSSYAETMCAWLAEVDMELFLRIWKEYAQKEGGEALQRMYPDREYFLRGIFKKKLVCGTRLFLGRDAAEYIKQNCRGKYRPYYVDIHDSASKDLAVFHLNLGKAHLVEGTHNFMLRILANLPPQSALQGNMTTIERYDLGTRLKKQYLAAFGSTGYFEKVHRGVWRRDAVSVLRSLGIPLLESDVIPKDSFIRRG